ncbi:hypothetical protein HPB47_010223 [Ixodes persulcatus]|uniref:Uncharacterized protein n=1 Tax=Ixodes persulcatus TaxID=34615 RepID=A0AC60NZQ8_IXOPE|nr:hypothetical protein HPB47_010223 [Ixodes persulcatus]
MGNVLCCCPDPDPGPASADRPLKFLDSAGGKSNTGGGSSAPSAAATPDWPAPDSVPQPPDSAPNSQGAVTTTLGERLMLYPRYSEARAAALFEKYRDAEDDAVLAEGIVRMCRDLGVRPEEFRVLLLAWKFGARQMCRFSREEFLSGCRALRADSTLALRARFPDMREEARDPARFRDLYRFTFKFGLEAGQRVLPTEMAAQLWRLVFSEAPPAVLERWLAFLEAHPEVRGITGDTWNMFLHFADTAGRDLSTYDDAEAWPSLFDDFVEFENDQTNQNVPPHPLKGPPDEVKAD